MITTRFDAATHTYYIAERPVPSVTQVLRDLLPGWQASEWYLQRGQAVHACAAMVARGQTFEYDPRIAGQVEAVRRFFREIQPTVIAVEMPVFSIPYQYGGTMDLACLIDGKATIADFKASLTPATIYQCAAYALPYKGWKQWSGLGVEIRDDGTYQLSERYPFTQRLINEWLALLTTYKVRKRLGVTTKGEGENGND